MHSKRVALPGRTVLPVALRYHSTTYDSVSYHSVSGVTNMRAVNDMERVARARVQQADQLGLADLALFHASC